jgi:hypothetical protein
MTYVLRKDEYDDHPLPGEEDLRLLDADATLPGPLDADLGSEDANG